MLIMYSIPTCFGEGDGHRTNLLRKPGCSLPAKMTNTISERRCLGRYNVKLSECECDPRSRLGVLDKSATGLITCAESMLSCDR